MEGKGEEGTGCEGGRVGREGEGFVNFVSMARNRRDVNNYTACACKV